MGRVCLGKRRRRRDAALRQDYLRLDGQLLAHADGGEEHAHGRRRNESYAEGSVLENHGGSIVSQLAPEGVIDEYQIVTAPLALGAGRTMFDGAKKAMKLSLQKTRSFA